ncbi:MAG: NADH-quinone oxidoreductase subunit L [Acidobacteriota bacterium]
MNFLQLVWLIPMFPLLGAVVMLFFGRKLTSPYWINLICSGSVLLSFLLSIAAIVELTSLPHHSHESVLYTWMPGLPFHTADGTLAQFSASWGFLLDPLSSVMILIITGIGFLIHVYATGYMAHEGGYYRFFGCMNLFVFFMLLLVMANNYVLLFAGWEGVGLCSYLLIGFYFHKKPAGDAGKKAFIVNRVGDAAFLLGMFLLLSKTGTLQFTRVTAVLESGNFSAETIGFGALSVAALLLFAGATGKSAQFPLYVWLPDAMEGPTPVSALIHAATMVTAGVYMVARSNALYALTPQVGTIVMAIGAFTAILAASIALVQTDIKRVLAYSTVSQLGYMFMAAGAGAYWVAVFHLYTHAFFKALLFLGAGSVIHAASGEQDMRRMGALRDRIPTTFRTMFIGSIAIAGIPGLAGFFSKDEILWQVFSAPGGSKLVYIVGLITAALTAFYMWRLMFMTFYGESRMDAGVGHHVHESPASMTVPLFILAAGSVLAGWVGVPKLWSVLPDSFRAFEHWLEPVLVRHPVGAPHNDSTLEWLLMAMSVALALGGIFFAKSLYGKRWTVDPIEALTGPLHRVLLNKWYVDEIYNYLFVDVLAKKGGELLARFDRGVVDGGVNGAGWLTRITSSVTIWWDKWIIDGAVRLAALLTQILSFPVRLVQTGQVQEYALVFLFGAALFFGWRWFV